MDIIGLHERFSIILLNDIHHPKGGKSPKHATWEQYRDEKISPHLLIDQERFGIVTGFEQLEVVDIDNHFFDADKMFNYICDNLPIDLFEKLVIIKTLRDGYHLYYKCEEIEGSKKLAMRVNDKGTPETLIETKGIGGYVAAPPTEGYRVIGGDLYEVNTISIEERNLILNICRSLNEVAPKEKIKRDPTVKVEGETPGSRYNSDPATFQKTIDLLKHHGWKSDRTEQFWKRPDKSDGGFSATFGRVGVNKFYVFSTNAYPFEHDTSYSMWGVLTMLEYDGDYNASAKVLAKEYGMKMPQKKEEKKQEQEPQKKTASSNKWHILEKIIKDWRISFRYNELTKIIEYKEEKEWLQLGLLPNDIVREMEVKRGVKSISLSKVIEMISSTSITEVYNPVKNFFANLQKWDGKDRIKELCQYVNLYAGEDSTYFESMLRKQLYRTVRCAVDKDYTNRFVFVLYGPQEIGKTLFFKWLCPSELYDDEMIDPSSKDSLLKLARYMMLNLDELDSLGRKDVSKLKAFISKGEIKTRVAYGRFDEMFNRIGSIFGSTNKSDILADESNTRWLILKVKSFDWQGYTKNINPSDIWAQAYAEVMDNKDIGELTSAEKGIREERNNQQFLEISQEREILEKYFSEGNIYYTATEVKMLIEEKLHPVKISMFSLVREMRRVFGEANLCKNHEGKTGRYYKLDDSKIKYTSMFTEEVNRSDWPY